MTIFVCSRKLTAVGHAEKIGVGPDFFAQFTLAMQFEIRYDISAVFDKFSPTVDKITAFMDGSNLIWKDILLYNRKLKLLSINS